MPQVNCSRSSCAASPRSCWAKMDFSGDIRATPASASEHFQARWLKTDAGYEVSDEGRTKSSFRRVD